MPVLGLPEQLGVFPIPQWMLGLSQLGQPSVKSRQSESPTQ